MKAEYLTHMGDDLMVVNAARVSFDKQSTWLNSPPKLYEVRDAEETYERWEVEWMLNAKDQKLIEYLAANNHWTPFSHPQIQFRITVPFFVANQLKRHVVGLSVNEVSRRYVDDAPEFYVPEYWRQRPEGSVKQGSSDEEVEVSAGIHYAYCRFLDVARNLYDEMLERGTAPEMARMVLPQSTYTSWIWTGSLMAFLRIYKQRSHPHAQREVKIIADQIGETLKTYFPYSFYAWNSSEGESMKENL